VETCTLLWVDLSMPPFTTGLSSQVPSTYRVCYLREPSEIAKIVGRLSPVAACFEYDEPESAHLERLRQTRMEFPSLPILMLTVKHSEELAVWALRMRVWDYIVLPVKRADLAARIAMLVSSRAMSSSREAILGHEALAGIAPPGNRSKKADFGKRLLPALSYVEENYSEKVALGVVAQLCGLGRYQFSRIFKRVHGRTFREFLILHRINKAIRMLGHPGASITDVAFAVGFNDLSHFAQMFRRYVGICPSDYLHQMKTVSQARVR